MTGRRIRTTDFILLIICYMFYAVFDLRGLAALIVISLFTYGGGWVINKARSDSDQRRSRMYCAMFTATLVGILCYFKYSSDVPLPVGMSFYMLMAISFIVDCQRGYFDEFPSPVEVLVFISFFPTIISGPILKARDFIPQIRSRQKLSSERLTRGLWLIAIGLFMKLCMADRLSVAVDKVYAAPLVYSGLTLFITSVTYSLQLLFDFAGYSNMAIGVATILGFDISPNFNLPYMATNPSEFWRRWHISLSSWLKEYVYIPLGGNRKGARRTYINILLVMIVSGLWHGSTINFLIWGILHGIGQMVHRAVRLHFATSTPKVTAEGASTDNAKDAHPHWIRIPSIILNFLFVNFLWIPFRAPTLSDTWTIISRIVTLSEGASYYYVYTFIFGAALLFVQYIGARYNNGNNPLKPLPLGRLYAKVIFCALLIATAMFAYFGNGAFIYAKF